MFKLYKKQLILFIAFLLFACSSYQAKASHIMGSDLSFRCIGTDSFIVRLILYRDCSGTALLSTQTVRVSSASCGRTFNVTVTRLAGSPIEVSPICPARAALSSCRGGTVPGVQQHIYEGLLIFPVRCTDWTMSWTTCCRNPAITTISSPGSVSTYIQATYNNTVYPCDNSPEFTSLPVPFICNNNPFVYNHGAVDGDRDSLYYSIVPCNTIGPTDYVPFIAPRTGLSPLSTSVPLTIDPLNGNVFITPNAIQVGIMAILVQEFRDGVLIGSTMRDIQVTVLRCDNEAPILDTIRDATGGGRITPYRYHVCSQDSISFNIYGIDTLIDTITMTTNIGISIPSARFTTPPRDTPTVVGTFSWRPTDADLGPHSFTITLQDNACPVFGTTIVAYDVVVVGVAIDAPDTQYVCYPPGATFTLEASGSASDYTWHVLRGDTSSLICDTCNPIVVTPTRTTTYEVIGETSVFGCRDRDTVTIVIIPQFTLNGSRDTTVCRGSPVRLSATPSISGSYVYTWFPRAGLSDSTAANPIATPTTSTTYYVHVVGGGTGGCDKWDTIRINVVNGGIFRKDVKICRGATYTYGTRVYPGAGIYNDTFGTTLAGCDSIFQLYIAYDTSVTFLNRQADTSVCLARSVYINDIIRYDTVITYDTFARCDSYSVASIPFAPIVGGGTPITLLATGSASVSPAAPIGFTFNFFCTNFTQFYAATNGFVTFTGGSPTGCCTGQLIPNISTPNNLIACGWNNYTLTGGGTVTYYTMGITPNRQLIINYNSLAHLTAGDGGPLTTQVILYENSNIIEVHTTSLRADYTGGSNGHTIGIENITGTRAHTPPGRNSTEGYTIVNESWRFSPYKYPVARKIPLNITWSPTTALSVTNRINPVASPSTTTTYTVTVFDSLCYFRDTVTISIRNKDSIYQSFNLCQGSIVRVGTRSYITTGNYRDTLRNSAGCDSLVLTSLVIIPRDSLAQTIIICNDSSYTYHGHTYTASGVYQDSFTNIYGCDSIMFTTLVVRPRSFVTQNIRLCIGQRLNVATHTYSLTGTYRDTMTNVLGCDSIITTNLTIDTLVVSRQTIRICPDQSYVVGPHSYSAAGVYRDTFPKPGGCDTIIETTIINTPISTTTITTSFCIGDTLKIGTSRYTTSGTRYDTLVNFAGCDSIITSNLTVYPTFITPITIRICYDQTYYCAGANQNVTGNYYDSLSTIHGCDSVIRTILTVTPLVTTNRTISICFGDSVFIQGLNRGSSGVYYDTFSSYLSCDSLLITTLIVKSHSYTTLNPTICNGTSYNVGIHTYTSAGSYQDTLVNYLGCDSVITTNLRVDTIVLAFSKRNVKCFSGNDGQINATSSGGTTPYQYNIGGAWQTSGLFTNISAGTYTLTVRDFTGCTTNTTVVITQPLRIIPTILVNTPTTCNGSSDGSLQIGTTNGTAPFQYSLNNVTYQVSNTLSGLAAGNYRAYVQDSLGCIDSINFTITQPAAIVIDAVLTQNKCHNDATGAITLSPRGGTAPFQYSIDGGVSYNFTNTFTGLTAGTYNVVVKDRNNCSSSISVTLINPSLFVINASGIDVQCWDSENGKITVAASGGTTPYSIFEYSQNGLVYNSSPFAVFENLTSGFYYVRATDANGCIATDTTSIGRPAIDTFSFIIDSTSCYGAQYTDGSIIVNALANPPYTWSIDGGPVQNFGFFYGLGAGTHIIVATNGNGCIDTLIQFVPFPPPVIVDVVPDTVYLELGSSQQVQVNVQNATNPTYVWNTLQGLSCNDCPNPIVNPYNDMVYTIRVYDHSHTLNPSDCYGDATLYVFVEEHVKSYVPNAFTPANGDGVNDILKVYGEGIKKLKFTIYDRWGELLFESNRQDIGWDGVFKGKLMNPGVYVYYVEAEYLDSKREYYQGSVTLLK